MIYYTGDIHGEVLHIRDMVTKYEIADQDVIVILGDVGMNYYGNNYGDQHRKKKLNKLGISVFCIHGNHEMRPETIPTYHEEKWQGGTVYVEDAYPNLLFAKDGEVYDLDQCYSSVRTGSYESRKKKGLPLDGICQTPMIPEWRLQMMANLIFRKYLSQKDKVLALANSILEAHIGDTEETQDKESILKAKQAELAKLAQKIDGYIEMRAEGDLSREAFRMKCAELEPRIQQLQKEIETLSAEAAPKEVVDYTEKLTFLQYALERYTNIDEGQDVPESVIEAYCKGNSESYHERKSFFLSGGQAAQRETLSFSWTRCFFSGDGHLYRRLCDTLGTPPPLRAGRVRSSGYELKSGVTGGCYPPLRFEWGSRFHSSNHTVDVQTPPVSLTLNHLPFQGRQGRCAPGVYAHLGTG